MFLFSFFKTDVEENVHIDILGKAGLQKLFQ